MASFTTRVLLEGDASYSEYELLHKKMEDKGFTRTITSTDGIVYKLPHAEYNFIGSRTKDEILGFAKEASKLIPNKTVQIIVTESSGRTWSNLDRV